MTVTRWLGTLMLEQLGKLNENSLEFWRKKLVYPRKQLPRRTDQGDVPHYKKHKKTLYDIQEKKCAGCGYFFALWALEVDHDIPQSKRPRRQH